MAIATNTTYRVDTHNVVHETIEGEVIVIHLLQGNYYSLGGSGPAIWQRLLAGASVEQIAGSIPTRGAGPGEAIEQVTSLIESLLADNLLEPAAEAPPEVPPAEEGEWLPPVLERYTDMNDYFLLDPIHEVDATGWPNRQET